MATFEGKNPALYERLASQFDDVTVELDSVDGSALVPAEKIVEVARFCRDDDHLEMGSLHQISGVDYLADEKIQVVYHLESITRNQYMVLKVDVPRDEPIVPSVCELWPSADWLERETYDLIGVLFDGHPNLRRILCSEDWEGHPLRKDYVTPAYYHGIPNVFFLEQLTEAQRELLFGGMDEEQRKLIYGA